MEVYSTEEQQVEAIKKFWKENGMQIAAGVVIGLGGFVGWNAYVDAQLESQEAASAAYQSFVEDTQAEDVTVADVEPKLEAFVSAHGDTGYDIFAHLIAAQKAANESQFESALSHLQQAESKTTESALKGLVSIRVARVQIELKQYDAALATLSSIENTGYANRIAELKGDVLLAQGNSDQARIEYQTAADNGGLLGNNVLKMKLDDLAQSNSSAN